MTVARVESVSVFSRLILAAVLSAFLAGGTATTQRQAVATETAPSSTAAEPEGWKAGLRADLRYLASDELRGRSVADESIHQAADYLAERFAQAGLKTDLFDGSPRQHFDVTLQARAGAAENNRAAFRLGAAEPASENSAEPASENSAEPASKTPEAISDDAAPGPDAPRDDAPATITVSLGDGLNPLAIGAAEANLNAPVTFVGYGITAPRLGYDDYAGVDVDGHAVLVLRKEPAMEDPDSPFDGTETTRHAYFQTKVENAARHGAAAVFLINDAASTAEAVREVEQRIADEKQRAASITEQLESLPAKANNSRDSLRKKLAGIEGILQSYRRELATASRGVLGVSEAGGGRSDPAEIPVLSLARDTADRLLERSSGRSLASLEAEIDQRIAPSSLRLPETRVALRSELKPTNVSTSNIVGVIPGRGALADENVVIGAHYDHVGMGGYGSLAPGTVAVHNGADDNASGTATLLAAATRLSGSLKDVASHRRIVFIAFSGEERGLLGSRHYVRHPRFPLEQTAAMINLDMVGRLKDNELTVYGTGSAVGIEAIVDRANRQLQFDLYKIASGYGPSDHQPFYRAGVPVLFFFTGLHPDYHRPSDDFDKIDFGGMARITDMVVNTAQRLAVREQRLEYAVTDKEVQIRRQKTAYLGVQLSDRGDHVVLAAVVSGGPADEAGLQPGDRLNRLGERQVGSVEDVLGALRQHSPGDTLPVQVRRGGQSIEIQVRLGQRR